VDASDGIRDSRRQDGIDRWARTFFWAQTNLNTEDCRRRGSIGRVRGEIAGVASALSNGGIPTSTAGAAANVLRHELGHVLGVGHPSVEDPICSATQDIVMQDPSLRIACGLVAPTSCDTTGMNSVYFSAPGYCSPSGISSCTGFCQ